MRSLSPQVMEFDSLGDRVTGTPTVGWIVRVTTDGEVIVDFPGNASGPMHARLALKGRFDKPDQQVLLVFENGDESLPIIAGIVRDSIDSSLFARSRDESALVFEAKKELTIVCGKSSINLRSDGRVTIKGVEILSRASGTNKIRGAAVKIN